MTRILLCHGIHTPEDDHVVQGLVPFLQDAGFEVIFPDYSWIGGLETRRLNPLISGVIRPFIRDGDIWIGHSNGCAIGYDLMSTGSRFGGMVFINGALSTNIVRSSCVPWIEVLFNGGDAITEVAQIAERLHLVDPSWGELGHQGYVGADPHIRNTDCSATSGMPRVSGHSDIFTPAKLGAWGPWIARRIRQLLTVD